VFFWMQCKDVKVFVVLYCCGVSVLPAQSPIWIDTHLLNLRKIISRSSSLKSRKIEIITQNFLNFCKTFLQLAILFYHARLEQNASQISKFFRFFPHQQVQRIIYDSGKRKTNFYWKRNLFSGKNIYLITVSQFYFIQVLRCWNGVTKMFV